MHYTTNYNLNKPDQTDQYNIEHFNGNADIIDAQMKQNADDIVSVDNATLKKTNNLSDLNDKSVAMTNIIDNYTTATDANVNSDNIEVMTRKVETENVITWYKTKFLSFWNYIKGKATSWFGITVTESEGSITGRSFDGNVTGNADTATKLKTAVNIDGVSFNGSKSITHYNVCTTSGSTAQKEVTLIDFTLTTGARISVRFQYANSATTPTLRIKTSSSPAAYTDVKGIRYQNNVALTSTTASKLWKAYQCVQLVYDGTYWLIDRPIDIIGNAGSSDVANYSQTYTYIIDSDTKLSNLFNNVSGHDYTHILVKKKSNGSGWSYSGNSAINLDTIGNKTIEGEPGAILNITRTYAGNLFTRDNLPTSAIDEYYIKNLKINYTCPLSGYGYRESLFYKCCNLKNVNVAITVKSGSYNVNTDMATICHSCFNVLDCRVDVSFSENYGKVVAFYNSENIKNLIFRSDARVYTSASETYRVFDTCDIVSNCDIDCGDSSGLYACVYTSTTNCFNNIIKNATLSAGFDDYTSNCFVPIGGILPFAGSTVPKGFLICDGSELSRTSYTKLFTVIGSKYGWRNGTATSPTYFRLPDLREAVPVGIGTNNTYVSGANGNFPSGKENIASHDTYSLGQFKDDRLQTHDHYSGSYQEGSGCGGFTKSGSSIAYGPKTSAVQEARTGDTTRTKQLGVNYIIRYI